jgi:hypothetical protein
MAGRDERLSEVLDGYDKFLLGKELATERQRVYLVRWVRRFLCFAREHCGYSFEQTLDLFLPTRGGRPASRLSV